MTGATVRTIVNRVDFSEGLSKAKIYVDNILQNTVSNSSVVRVRSSIGNSTKSSLVIPTGTKYLSKILQTPEDSKFLIFSDEIL